MTTSKATTRASIIKQLKSNALACNAYNKLHVPINGGKASLCVGGAESYTTSELQGYLTQGAWIC